MRVSAICAVGLFGGEGGTVGASNTAPAFRTGAADQTATVGEAFSYTAPAAVDAENHTLTYGAALTNGNALPDWLRFAAGTHVLGHAGRR